MLKKNNRLDLSLDRFSRSLNSFPGLYNNKEYLGKMRSSLVFVFGILFHVMFFFEHLDK